MTKKLSLFLATVMAVSSLTASVCADNITVKERHVSESVQEIDSRSVSISRDFIAYVGQSWSTNFTLNNILADPHDAFKVVVSNVNGSSYKVILTNDDGFEYVSDEYTKAMSFTLTEGFPDTRYTVRILNTDSSDLTGHVTVSSYYN